ncbi:uncharacterized protein LOC113871436 [Abrus precatorius]|uniref:Uncharacterized protein LOC113871436 n=1 Tax=Abrus precatorius TaxID=3816 RepID=A0A8B8MB71_ABRPR|nr:uncharacterized protein LOC113871436 [Abrus precatorius]
MNNGYNVEHNALATLEEMRGPPTSSVVCPQPRRVVVSPNMPTRPFTWIFCQQGEEPNSNAGLELLDIISNISYSYYEQHNTNQEASSPPFFLGSPPVRTSNPLIQDAQFGHEKHTPQSRSPISSPPSLSSPSSASSQGLFSPSSSLRKGGCVRMKFGIKSTAVRVVGFDCHVPAFG